MGQGGQGSQETQLSLCGKRKAESKAICLPVRLGAMRGQRMDDLRLVMSRHGATEHLKGGQFN